MEGRVAQAGVLEVADAVFGAGTLAVPEFQIGEPPASAFARARPKSRTVCCCATLDPLLNQSCSARHPVRCLSSSAGPHSPLIPVSMDSWCAAFEYSTHRFHTHRQRSHSASNNCSAVPETRSRYLYRTLRPAAEPIPDTLSAATDSTPGPDAAFPPRPKGRGFHGEWMHIQQQPRPASPTRT